MAGSESGISNLYWWKREYGFMKLVDIDRTVIRSALNKLKDEDATHGNGAGRRKSRGHKRSNSTVRDNGVKPYPGTGQTH